MTVAALSRRRILLLWSDAKERQALFKILCATGADVAFSRPEEADMEAVHNCELLVLDYDSMPDMARSLLARLSDSANAPPVLVVTARRAKEELREIVEFTALTNLFAKNTDVRSYELIVTVQKIIRNDIFGLDKYLTWGAYVYETPITSSLEKSGVLGGLSDYLTSIGCNRRLMDLAQTVGDEFIMNAIYNAPVGDQGAPKYASLARSEPVNLEPHEHALFRYACDGKSLGISIQDNFGRLERSTVLSYLRKAFRMGDDQVDTKEGGAGLGLYYIFESLNQFIINVSPGRCTEMIGLLDVSGTYRDFAEQPKSLNIFTKDGTQE